MSEDSIFCFELFVELATPNLLSESLDSIVALTPLSGVFGLMPMAVLVGEFVFLCSNWVASVSSIGPYLDLC